MNRRSLTVLVEFLIIFGGALLGGLISFVVQDSFTRLLLVVIVAVSIFSLIVGFDIYDKPRRLNEGFLKENTHTNTKLIMDDIKSIREELRSLRNNR